MSKIITGADLRYWIRTILSDPSTLEKEDRCVVAQIIWEIAQHGQFDCAKYWRTRNRRFTD